MGIDYFNNPRNIADAFTTAASQATESRSGFVRTIETFRSIVNKMQDAGVTNIGFQIADFNDLQATQMLPTQPDEVYAFIKVYDATFIARIHDDNNITMHTRNINKIHTNVEKLRNEKNIDKKIANLKLTTRLLDDSDVFHKDLSDSYNLSEKESCNELIEALIQMAAISEANNGLKKYNFTPNGIYKP